MHNKIIKINKRNHRKLNETEIITRQMNQKQSLSTTSIMDLQLLCQKICQKISVIKTDTSDDITKIVHFGILIHVWS